MKDKIELVFKVLKNSEQPLKSGEIAELSKIDKKEVSKIINVLKKEGRIESPKRCYYKAK